MRVAQQLSGKVSMKTTDNYEKHWQVTLEETIAHWGSGARVLGPKFGLGSFKEACRACESSSSPAIASESFSGFEALIQFSVET